MAFGFAAVPMPKPSFVLRAERSGAFDLSSPTGADTAGGGFFPRSGKRDLVFIVNPKSANGRTEREWKKLLPYLRSRLRECCNIHETITSGASHGTDITREALRDGADAVIAVGGDGTLHEVVNGFFLDGKPVHAMEKGYSTALGLIPLGTGSDFARTFGWKNDAHEAIERIIRGYRLKVDVGFVNCHSGEEHYFINVADVHLSAKAGYYASKYKSWGNICYVIGALRAFVGHKNSDLRIKVDGGEWEVLDKVTALCVGNAKYFGGGMKITPTADPSSGFMEVVILQNFKWYDFILKLHKLYSGSHVSEQNVSLRSVKLIEVEEVPRKGDIYVQCDGEHIGFLPAKFLVLPAAIDILI